MYLKLIDKLKPDEVVNAVFSFFVYNQILDNYFIKQDMTGKPFSVLKAEWGIAELLSLNTFNDPLSTTAVCLELSWTVSKYFQLNDQFFLSPVFTFDGISWKLFMYPGGAIEEGKNISISLCLHDHSKLTYAGEKIFVEYEIILKDQLGGNDIRTSAKTLEYKSHAYCGIAYPMFSGKGKDELVGDEIEDSFCSSDLQSKIVGDEIEDSFCWLRSSSSLLSSSVALIRSPPLALAFPWKMDFQIAQSTLEAVKPHPQGYVKLFLSIKLTGFVDRWSGKRGANSSGARNRVCNIPISSAFTLSITFGSGVSLIPVRRLVSEALASWPFIADSLPLADAIYYQHHDVVKILESYGAKPLGDLRALMKRKGPLKPWIAVKLALDVARCFIKPPDSLICCFFWVWEGLQAPALDTNVSHNERSDATHQKTTPTHIVKQKLRVKRKRGPSDVPTPSEVADRTSLEVAAPTLTAPIPTLIWSPCPLASSWKSREFWLEEF
ncbi:hypothetical protein Dimus_009881 [Dionaea muscipula]